MHVEGILSHKWNDHRTKSSIRAFFPLKAAADNWIFRLQQVGNFKRLRKQKHRWFFEPHPNGRERSLIWTAFERSSRLRIEICKPIEISHYVHFCGSVLASGLMNMSNLKFFVCPHHESIWSFQKLIIKEGGKEARAVLTEWCHSDHRIQIEITDMHNRSVSYCLFLWTRKCIRVI